MVVAAFPASDRQCDTADAHAERVRGAGVSDRGRAGLDQFDRFEIEAKADGNATRDQMFLMLQSLLEERYQLTFQSRDAGIAGVCPGRRERGLNCRRPSKAPARNQRLDAADWAGGIMARHRRDGLR